MAFNFLKKRKIQYLLLFLLLIFIMTFAVIGSFSSFRSFTAQSDFCLSCHEMDHPYEEYKKSPHSINASGFKVGCTDCHMPTGNWELLTHEIGSLGRLYHTFTGSINTAEKFQEKRLELAKRVWTHLEENNSAECRSCHDENSFDYEKFQDSTGAEQMQKGLADGKTCIDCHKGIAHELPDMTSGYKSILKQLVVSAKEIDTPNDSIFSISTKKLYLTQDDIANSKSFGKLLPLTEVESLEQVDDAIKIRIKAWQQDQVESVLYAAQGKRIFSAVLRKNATQHVDRKESIVDPDTEQKWHRVELIAWTGNENLTQLHEMLLDYGAELHSASCSTCHSTTAADHFTANQWIGNLKSMKRNLSLTKPEYRILLKYLQLHASDMSSNSNH